MVRPCGRRMLLQRPTVTAPSPCPGTVRFLNKNCVRYCMEMMACQPEEPAQNVLNINTG